MKKNGEGGRNKKDYVKENGEEGRNKKDDWRINKNNISETQFDDILLVDPVKEEILIDKGIKLIDILN